MAENNLPIKETIHVGNVGKQITMTQKATVGLRVVTGGQMSIQNTKQDGVKNVIQEKQQTLVTMIKKVMPMRAVVIKSNNKNQAIKTTKANNKERTVLIVHQVFLV